MLQHWSQLYLCPAGSTPENWVIKHRWLLSFHSEQRAVTVGHHLSDLPCPSSAHWAVEGQEQLAQAYWIAEPAASPGSKVFPEPGHA